jgi:hypothetical protein
MKRVTLLMLMVQMFFVLAGCGGSSPKERVITSARPGESLEASMGWEALDQRQICESTEWEVMPNMVAMPGATLSADDVDTVIYRCKLKGVEAFIDKAAQIQLNNLKSGRDSAVKDLQEKIESEDAGLAELSKPLVLPHADIPDMESEDEKMKLMRSIELDRASEQVAIVKADLQRQIEQQDKALEFYSARIKEEASRRAPSARIVETLMWMVPKDKAKPVILRAWNIAAKDEVTSHTFVNAYEDFGIKNVPASLFDVTIDSAVGYLADSSYPNLGMYRQGDPDFN